MQTTTHRTDSHRKSTRLNKQSNHTQLLTLDRSSLLQELALIKLTSAKKLLSHLHPSDPFSLFPNPHAPFTEQSVHRQDYTFFPTSLQKSYKPTESRHISDLPFQASTEHRSNFYTKTLEANHSYKPEPTVYRPSSQPLDATTPIAMDLHTKRMVTEIVKPIRQKAELFIHSGAFDADTVHRSDFKGVVNKICPAEFVLTRRDRSYKLQGQRNGHRYYRKVVASVPDQVRLRRMSPVQG
uniref:Uncharacterized protein n=1 Tax=Ditylenchus dipsaci TaxID=166011 RepID=A0A915DWE5_9BILA